MSYSTANRPICLAGGMGHISSTLAVIGTTALTAATNVFGGTRLWVYYSSDTSTLIQAPGYFTDGYQLGMRNGDFIINGYASSRGASPSAVQLGIIVTTNSTAGFNVAIGAAIASS